jgi:catechol-2,3-dioxygenase
MGKAAPRMSDSVHIHPTTEIGAVRLAVADVQRAQSFYEHVLGLSVVDRDADATRLGAGDEALVELVAASQAGSAGRGATGLFTLRS